MLTAVTSIRWDTLSTYVQKHAPKKPIEDHPNLQIDGKVVSFREGICTDPSLQPDPFLISHLIIDSNECSPDASLLSLDPKKRQGSMLLSNKSAAVINEDATIASVGVPDAYKTSDSEPTPSEQEMRDLATSHLGMHLKILRQMGLV